MKKKSLHLISFMLATLFAKAQTPDWSTSIASVFYNNCTTCHNDGGIAPFSLVDYNTAVDNGFNIQANVNSKKMPPWPADPNYNHFWDEKVLSDEEITSINDWVDGGMPSGDLSQAPPPPVYNGLSSMINPDDSVFLTVYTIPSDTDDYRTFVVHSNYTTVKYINQIEFIPGDPSTVHHATVAFDTSDISWQKDVDDPLPGFETNLGDVSPYTISFAAWHPGKGIFKLLPNMGLKILPNADFVVAIHYAPGSYGKTDSSKIYFKFCTVPDSAVREVKRQRWLTTTSPILTNGPFIIPADQVKTFNEVSLSISPAKSLLAINPHSHHVCVSWKIDLVNSPGDTTNLIYIPSWKFDWQFTYFLTKVVKVPTGSTFIGEAVFDNTTNNPDNPHNPPTLIHEGEKSDQEMMLGTFIIMDYKAGDEDMILDSAFYGLPTSISAISDQLPLEIYPNPATNVFHFVSQLNTHDVNWMLTNSFGIVVRSSVRNTVASGVYVQDVDVNDLPAGMYQLHLQSGGESKTKKIILAK